jgi:uncharacterized protein (TIGR03435 family)
VITTWRSATIGGYGSRRLITYLQTLVVAIVHVNALSAQRVPTISSAAPEKFQVASVKRNNSQDRAWRYNYQGETFAFINGPVRDLVRLAYGIGSPYARPLAEIAGEPAWVDERYDIVAKTDGPVTPLVRSAVGPVNRMLQALLADRFKLAVHWELRGRPGFVLERVPGASALGPNLRPTPTVDCPAYFAADRAARLAGRPRPDPIPGRTHPAPICAVRARDTEILIGAQSVQVLADTLSNTLRRVVVDRSGLAGSFDIQLTFSHIDVAVPDLPEISIFDALRDQLGLRLEPRASTVDVLVIDSLQRPSEN